MTGATPTDRPKSVRNRCVIELFGDVFVLSSCCLDFTVGVVAFVIGLRLFLFLFPLIKYRHLLSIEVCTFGVPSI